MTMMMYSYDNQSESGRALATFLGIGLINHENSRFKGAHGRWVVNWGSSTLPEQVRRCSVLNEERGVWLAVNKLRTFEHLSKFPLMVPKLPEWTTSPDVARRWAVDNVVYCRTRVAGADGQGVVVARAPEQVVQAPLYTKRVNTAGEYRLTVFNDEVIGIQEKVRADGFQGVQDNFLRTTAGGWGFRLLAHGEHNRMGHSMAAALDAVHALGLNFAGVDVVLDNINRLPRILEVNTAPQLTPVMTERLGRAIMEYTGHRREAAPNVNQQ